MKLFCDIKNKLNTYNKSLDNETILMNEEINLDSIYKFTLNNKLINQINEEIRKIGGWVEVYHIKKDDFSKDIKRFDFFNIKSIEELNKLLIRYEKEIINFAKEWLKDYKKARLNIPNDITYFYLFYLLSYLNNNIDEYVLSSSIKITRSNLKKEIEEICKKIGLSKSHI